MRCRGHRSFTRILAAKPCGRNGLAPQPGRWREKGAMECGYDASSSQAFAVLQRALSREQSKSGCGHCGIRAQPALTERESRPAGRHRTQAVPILAVRGGFGLRAVSDMGGGSTIRCFSRRPSIGPFEGEKSTGRTWRPGGSSKCLSRGPGTFVQSSHFIEDAGEDTMKRVTFYGHEKNDTTAKLA